MFCTFAVVHAVLICMSPAICFVCMHACTYVHTCTHVCECGILHVTFIQLCCVYGHVCIYMDMYIYVYRDIDIYVFTYVLTYSYSEICTRTRMHIHPTKSKDASRSIALVSQVSNCRLVFHAACLRKWQTVQARRLLHQDQLRDLGTCCCKLRLALTSRHLVLLC